MSEITILLENSGNCTVPQHQNREKVQLVGLTLFKFQFQVQIGQNSPNLAVICSISPYFSYQNFQKVRMKMNEIMNIYDMLSYFSFQKYTSSAKQCNNIIIHFAYVNCYRKRVLLKSNMSFDTTATVVLTGISMQRFIYTSL